CEYRTVDLLTMDEGITTRTRCLTYAPARGCDGVARSCRGCRAQPFVLVREYASLDDRDTEARGHGTARRATESTGYAGDAQHASSRIEPLLNALPLPMSEPFTASIRTRPLSVKASLFVSGTPAWLVARQLASSFFGASPVVSPARVLLISHSP